LGYQPFATVAKALAQGSAQIQRFAGRIRGETPRRDLWQRQVQLLQDAFGLASSSADMVRNPSLQNFRSEGERGIRLDFFASACELIDVRAKPSAAPS
jgi:hypothetical protein